MIGLKDRKVVITGAASGIGYATAIRFLAEGCRVAVLDSDGRGCQRLEQEKLGLSKVVVTDVSDQQSVQEAFRELDELWGSPDVVINNAGISLRHEEFVNITAEDWQKVLNVNLNGVFFVAQEAAKRMVEAGSGVIINMGSTNALMGYRYYFDYNASKAGVVELTRSLALELAPTVRVIAVCPGYVLTPMQEAEYTPEMMAELNDKIPLRRHATTEEVAALFAFLASDEAPYITGQCIIIDGGETAGGLASR